jgi:transposase InsO family protein
MQNPENVASTRFRIIAPLIEKGLDKGKFHQLMREIAEREGISDRTIRRYLEMYRNDGFSGLKPAAGWTRPDSKLPDNFPEILKSAIELRRDVPTRSVRDLLEILRLEGMENAGVIARSTLQRHLQAEGYGTMHMKKYSKAAGSSARRFQKEHRSQLWQSDIKYGPFTYIQRNGRKGQIFLVVFIDDATRFIMSAKFYDNQRVEVIEDSLRRAVTMYGVPEKIFVDNGKQYRSKWLSRACDKLGIRLLTAKPYHPEAKGKVERFNAEIDKFLAEAVLKKPADINEYNDLLKLWIDEYYAKHAHSGLNGVSPQTRFETDTRPLKFVSAEMLRDAFFHRENRRVNKVGCISFDGKHYEVGLEYIGRTVEVAYDITWTDEIEIHCDGHLPFVAKRLQISENCGVKPELPTQMKTKAPETSRLLDALEANRTPKEPGIATQFKGFWQEADNV